MLVTFSSENGWRGSFAPLLRSCVFFEGGRALTGANESHVIKIGVKLEDIIHQHFLRPTTTSTDFGYLSRETKKNKIHSYL